MQDFQKEFLGYCLERDVLRFGEFTLKSGRVSPYFFNAGLFNTSADLAALGNYYARAIQHANVDFDILFGPAYKGIPLAAITAAALYNNFQYECRYAFDRKEVKDHGEGGQIVGAEIAGKILIIDDVITAGTAIRQSMNLMSRLGGQVVGVSIALDRQEKGQSDKSAIQELEAQGLQVIPIIKMRDIMDFLKDIGKHDALEKMDEYRQRYGI